MISTTAELRELASQVRDSEWVALDTEADSLHAYPEKLCLLQVGVPGGEFLVDPMADLHLEPLWEPGRAPSSSRATSLRLLFRGHFQTRSIFDRAGGPDRGGPLGLTTPEHPLASRRKGSQKATGTPPADAGHGRIRAEVLVTLPPRVPAELESLGGSSGTSRSANV